MVLGRDVQPIGRATEASMAQAVIVSSVASGLRRQLIEGGTWDRVRKAAIARDPLALEWIDTPLAERWIPIERHLQIMTALADVVGEDGTREVGCERLRQALSAGVLAPLLRGWLRSYSSAPVHLLRVAPHAWSAVLHGAGRIELASSDANELRFHIVGVPESVSLCRAWHRFIEGWGQGILEAGGHEGSVEVCADAPHRVIAACRWR